MPADITLNAGAGGAIIATDPTTSSEHYQLIKLAQGAVGTFTLVTTANAFPVVTGSSFPGGIVSLSSQVTVTATGPMTITSGLVTLSSTPTVFSASSGGIQAFIPVTAGAGFGPVTSSAGVLASLSSGTVTLSSQISVTSTAATNPWSSAPGFNVPMVSASSGLVQIAGTPAVNLQGTQASLPFVTVATSGTFAAALVVISTSTAGGGAGSTSVNLVGTGPLAPVTSSGGLLVTVFDTAQVVTVSSGSLTAHQGSAIGSTGPGWVTNPWGIGNSVMSTSAQTTSPATGATLATVTPGVVGSWVLLVSLECGSSTLPTVMPFQLQRNATVIGTFPCGLGSPGAPTPPYQVGPIRITTTGAADTVSVTMSTGDTGVGSGAYAASIIATQVV